MAWTAHTNNDELHEHECDAAELDKHASRLATWIQESEYTVFFTGAGISTSAGIPDFRGPNGVWTMKAQGRKSKGRPNFGRVVPTPTHMSLVALEKQNLLQFLISQNVDGLHLRSGFPKKKLAELHGNTNLEFCKKCGKEYLREFSCRQRGLRTTEHKTGRQCSCGASLQDSIINFGEDLPKKALDDGFDASDRSTLFVVLGSSLTVTPAADMPKEAERADARLVVVNLQKTPLDGDASLRIFAKTDDLMIRVMKNLGINVPKWVIYRKFKITKTIVSSTHGSNKCVELHVKNKSSGAATPIMSEVEVDKQRSPGEYRLKTDHLALQSPPFDFSMGRLDSKRASVANEGPYTVTLRWASAYNEPPIQVNIVLEAGPDPQSWEFEFRLDPETGSVDGGELMED